MEVPTFTHAELLASGLSPDDIARSLASGALHRIRRGVYTLRRGASDEERHRELVAACRRVVGPGNVLSHTSAALAHGLPVRRRALEQATFTRLTPGHADKQPHLHMRNTAITEAEITTLDDGLTTTLARTVADIARTEPVPWGVAAADAALARGLERDELFEALGAHRRLHGIRRGMRVAHFADPLAESPLESISRFTMHLAGLPAPELQVEFFDEDGVFAGRTDFFWRDHGVVGECHGLAKYGEWLAPGESAQDVIRAQLQRTAALRALGLHVVEWGWDEATNVDRLGATLWPAIHQGQGRRWQPPWVLGA